MTSPRYLTESFAVAPQIGVDDLDELKAQGFRTIVCNRPDGEVQPDFQAAAIENGCKARGLNFVLNPLTHGMLTDEHVEIQRQTTTGEGPVLAYCASGNRSSILWSLAMAGTLPVDDILNRAAEAGYNLEGLRPQLEAMSKRG